MFVSIFHKYQGTPSADENDFTTEKSKDTGRPPAGAKNMFNHEEPGAAFGRNQNIISRPFASLIQDAKTPRKESSRHAPRAVRHSRFPCGLEYAVVALKYKLAKKTRYCAFAVQRKAQ